MKGHRGAVKALSITPDGRIAVSGSEDNTLRVWDIETGVCLSIGTLDIGNICSISLGKGNLFVHVVGGSSGDVCFLNLKNMDQGIPYALPIRLWRFRQMESFGIWDKEITTLCEYCGERFPLEESILFTIKDISSHLSSNQSPCLTLPTEAWDDPRLLSECTCCHKPLRYNPFIVDNREKESYLTAVNPELHDEPKLPMPPPTHNETSDFTFDSQIILLLKLFLVKKKLYKISSVLIVEEQFQTSGIEELYSFFVYFHSLEPLSHHFTVSGGYFSLYP